METEVRCKSNLPERFYKYVFTCKSRLLLSDIIEFYLIFLTFLLASTTKRKFKKKKNYSFFYSKEHFKQLNLLQETTYFDADMHNKKLKLSKYFLLDINKV